MTCAMLLSSYESNHSLLAGPGWPERFRVGVWNRASVVLTVPAWPCSVSKKGRGVRTYDARPKDHTASYVKWYGKECRLLRYGKRQAFIGTAPRARPGEAMIENKKAFSFFDIEEALR